MPTTARLISLFLGIWLTISCTQPTPNDSFVSSFPKVNRSFIGPSYWANRLQDWQLNDGRLECLVSAPNRNLQLLTWDLQAGDGELNTHATFGFMSNKASSDQAYVGIRLGAQGRFQDYRDNAIYGKGIEVGITPNGQLFIGNPKSGSSVPNWDINQPLELRAIVKESAHKSMLQLQLIKPASKEVLHEISTDTIPAARFAGNIALVSHFPDQENGLQTPSLWVSNWEASGSKLVSHPERAYGPIMFSHYTLNQGIMKMTAQLAPMGSSDASEVQLEVKTGDNWKQISQASIDQDARTATFRIENWEAQQDIPYRLAYELACINGKKTYYWEGIVRKDPVDKQELIVAGFTGNNDLGFPNKNLTDNVVKHNPDFLFFSGDQIYERVGGYGIQVEPVETSLLDYLHKWYMFGWTYRELMKDRPSVCMPDDHDVYHGNIWGEGGKAAQKEGNNFDKQDSGGFKRPPRFVKMVERTQTAHLPDPFDPTPVKQGIGVYYNSFVYGGISFAMVEDRKFKSAPKALLPEAEVNNGWAQNRKWNAKKKGDVKGAVLLGARQLDFLESWSQDWKGGAVMKCVLSQTIFANVATLPESEFHDKIVPKLRILEADEYAPDDRPVSDMDSNGWPQTGRNKALEAIRKGFAFHIAGDQHLGSTIQYGVDEWRDAGFAFCVPAVSNIWPRRWYPQKEGKNREASAPKYTGDFEDGFGNKISVHAVSNPVFTGRKPANLHDRATGYGIVRFQKADRTIEISCWPRDIDPTQADAQQYPGWPISVQQEANYGREAKAWLPDLEIEGMDDPVIKVSYVGKKLSKAIGTDQAAQQPESEFIYALRIKGNRFSPKVFKKGVYKILVGDPDQDLFQEMLVESSPKKGIKTETVQFN